MKTPKTFVSKHKNLEKRIRELREDDSKGESYIKELELLKTGRTREDKKAFLESFVKYLPYLTEKLRGKMERTNVNKVYLDDPKDCLPRDWGYRTRFEIQHGRYFYFLHSVCGVIYASNLDSKEFYGHGRYIILHSYLDTYPDKENDYLNMHSRDTLGRSFKAGKEMYESIKLFLEENKTL